LRVQDKTDLVGEIACGSGIFGSIRSPNELAGIAEELGDTIILDETLGIGDAAAMVWDLRSVSGSSIRTLTLPTEPATLTDGSFAVRATTSFAALISR